jgi:hypothetical protein
MTTPTKKTTPRSRTPAKTNVTPLTESLLAPEIVSRVTLADNREVRITRIKTGLRENLIRVGINLLPNGENMSGAVFPESYTDDIIAALRKVG